MKEKCAIYPMLECIIESYHHNHRRQHNQQQQQQQQIKTAHSKKIACKFLFAFIFSGGGPFQHCGMRSKHTQKILHVKAHLQLLHIRFYSFRE